MLMSAPAALVTCPNLAASVVRRDSAAAAARIGITLGNIGLRIFGRDVFRAGRSILPNHWQTIAPLQS